MTISARALACLVSLLSVGAACYWAGDHQRNNAWLAKQADIERQANEDYKAEVERGNQAAGDFLQQLGNQEDRYAELESKFEALRKRVPLLVSAAAGPAPAPVAEPQTGADAACPAPPQCINVLVRPELSLAAVRMWNSALYGADVPAGTCGADAATEQTCAAGSGITVDDAWDNHAINARSCAKDRLRYNRLIDYLEGRTP